jgi:hypothetical protein
VRVGRIETVVRKFFGFMFKSHFRCAYIIFIGTIPLGLGKCGLAMGILMMANAIFNYYVLTKYPMLKGNDAQALTPSNSSAPAAGF